MRKTPTTDPLLLPTHLAGAVAMHGASKLLSAPCSTSTTYTTQPSPLLRKSTTSKAATVCVSLAALVLFLLLGCVFVAMFAWPKHETPPAWDGLLPATGMSASLTHSLTKSVMAPDVVPSHNFATFVTTQMEPEAMDLLLEGMTKNFADKEEYSGTAELHQRTLTMIAQLFHAPSAMDGGQGVGTATVGSSEAAILAFLAQKWRWRKRRQAQGLPIDKPNIVIPSSAHISLKKFAKYFDVELRLVDVHAPKYTVDPAEFVSFVDENTIGACLILGSTYNGQFDDVQRVNDLLEEMMGKHNGMDIPLHIDAASGGFVAPFLYPDLKWDFRLSRVRSINTSGHKYGGVFAGVGWLVFRETTDLPDDLVYDIDYLGGSHKSFTLNFSRSSHQVIAQFYQMMRLGKAGYSDLMQNLMRLASLLGDRLKELDGRLAINCDNADPKLPVVAFTMRADDPVTGDALVGELKKRGWSIPSYAMPTPVVMTTHDPPNGETMMRIVVRNDFTVDTMEALVGDVKRSLATLDQRHAALV